MSKPNLANPWSAALWGIVDRLRPEPPIGRLDAGDRLDGRTALVTGASSGLGFATTVDLARRGARVLMACRSGIPRVRDEARALASSMAIDALPVDLSDLDSIRALIEELDQREERIDVLVLNAAVVPAEARHTPQGLPEMFVVNYFSSFLLVRELVDRGLLALATERSAAHDERSAEPIADRPRSGRADGDGQAKRAVMRPRIVIVSSEAHRSGADLDLGMIERFVPHSLGQAVARYGYYKLMLTTFACELDRQLNPASAVRCAVHVLCPGAVNTRIAREVPPLLRPLADTVLRLAFRDPFDADEPVVFLAASRRLEGQSGLYLHRMTRKPVDERASNAEAGRRLWTESERLRERMWRQRTSQTGIDVGAIGAAIAG